ncbi:MAG: hypothetical protein KBD01_02680 [Acidobacteria bacterium]|nr:hypothetical protein [Acidobacteriota bacterium]
MRRGHEPVTPEQLGWLRWEALKRRVDVRLAAAAFAVTFLALAVAFNVAAPRLHDAVRSAVLALSHEDIDADSGSTDSLVRAHLARTARPGTREVVLLGASYTASSFETDPSRRLHRLLCARLEHTTGADWDCENLAHSGYDTWCNFYIARLLRERRRPDYLVVSFDTFVHKVRSRHLVLNTGDSVGLFTADELASVVPRNRQPLYRAEARGVAVVRAWAPAFETLERARRTEEGLAAAAGWLASRVRDGRWDTPLLDYVHPDGRRKSWREMRSALSRVERMKARPVRPDAIGPVVRDDMELLGRELAALEAAGTRVLVLTMPKNPQIVYEFEAHRAALEDWAVRYGIEFHDYWTSGIIPDRWFADTGHFFGEGCAIMADRIGGWIEQEEARSR